MPISGVLIYNSSAEAIIRRFYKSDYSRVAAEAFRVKVIQAKNFRNPVLILDRSTFMYIRYNDLIITALTKQNANATLVFQFLYQLVDIFRVKLQLSHSQKNKNNNHKKHNVQKITRKVIC